MLRYASCMPFSSTQKQQTKPALAELLRHPSIWQASEQARTSRKCYSAISTGHQAFDNQLHLSGWPCADSTELLASQYGIGELELLLPTLSTLAHQNNSGWLAFIAPPYQPYAPALARSGIPLQRLLVIQPRNLKENLWACEQLLRSGHFSAVLNWLGDNKLSYSRLRRIQIASQEGASWSINFRSEQCATQSSPAKLRVRLQATQDQLLLNIIKQHGGWGGQSVCIKRNEVLLSKSTSCKAWGQKNKQVHKSSKDSTKKQAHSLAIYLPEASQLKQATLMGSKLVPANAANSSLTPDKL